MPEPTIDDRHRIRLVLGKHPSGVLLGAQFTAVIAYPFLDDSAAGRSVLGVLQMGVVLIAMWAVRRTPSLSWVAAVVGGPAMIFTVLEALSPQTDWIVLVSALLHAPFYFYVSYSMIRYLFHDEVVTRDELFATGAAFTVVAWGFAYVYVAIDIVWPESFSVVGNPLDARTWFEMLFLSVTTMTSTGLSDIYPIRPHARSFVMLEQIAGMLYLALVVARMIALTVSKTAARKQH